MKINKRFGFNLIGFATANFGLGISLRNTAGLLEKSGHAFCVLDLDPGGNRTGHDLSMRRHFLKAGESLPYPVNLFHMNPPGLEGLFRDLPGLVETRGRMNVCVPFWELPHLPLDWRPQLRTMDLLLGPSKFVQAALEEAVPEVPCLYYRQPLPLPPVRPDRERWGLPPDRVAFLFSFDVSSGIQRKNPVAVLQAFRAAFPAGTGSAGPLLVIKVNNAGLSPEAAEVVGRFKALAASLIPGVRVVDRSLPYAEVLSLYASCDVYVSLHRGEGLGLGLMECMALGKPVIGTAWSGNMDFMDEHNSCLVPYTLVPVAEGTQYRAMSQGLDQVWAEPSLEEAARWMAALAVSPGLRAEIGARAGSALERYREEADKGSVFAEIRNRVPVP